MPRYWASVATTLTPTGLGPLPWAACPTPELSDWHPKGKVSTDYDLWNEERGASNRAVLVVDTNGVIRFRETYVPGVLPDVDSILAAMDDVT